MAKLVCDVEFRIERLPKLIEPQPEFERPVEKPLGSHLYILHLCLRKGRTWLELATNSRLLDSFSSGDARHTIVVEKSLKCRMYRCDPKFLMLIPEICKIFFENFFAGHSRTANRLLPMDYHDATRCGGRKRSD
jgi:hypothetical protein